MLVLILAVSTALVFSFLCSISEAVLFSVSRTRVAAMAKEGSRAGHILQRFKREPDVAIAAILILNTIAHTIGASVAGAKYVEVVDEGSLWLFVLVFTVAVLLFTEIVPKTIGITHSGRLARPVALGVDALMVAFRPLLFITRKISGLLRRGAQVPVTSLEEIRLLTAIGRSEGVFGPHTASMIEGATLLRDLNAGDAMIPRNRITYLSGDRTLEENLALVQSSGYSRFPFTRSGNIDKVEGVILSKDLLFHIRNRDGEPDWGSLLRPLILVPETTPLQAALRQFQKERRHLAIVVDEYGGTHGILTLEDVIEEIVGEIEDETDRQESLIVERPDGGLTCRGLAETRKVFGLLGIDTEVESNTLSGFMTEHLESLPQTGQTLDWQGYRFTVTQATKRRAELIDVVRLPESAGNIS